MKNKLIYLGLAVITILGTLGFQIYTSLPTLGTYLNAPTNNNTSTSTFSNNVEISNGNLLLKNNQLSEHPSLKFMDIQTTSGSSTIMRIKAPKNGGLFASEEATLSLTNDISGDNSGVNEESVDVYTEHYDDSKTWGMREIYRGTGACKPAQFGQWDGIGAKNDGNKLILQCSGTVYVGAGAAAPASTPAELTAQLHVASSTATYVFLAEDGTPGSDTTPFVIDGGGKVGIGVKDPSSRLHIKGSSSDTTWANHPIDVSVWFQNSDATNNNWFNLLFRSNDDTVASGITNQVYDQTNSYGAINFETRGASGYKRVMEIKDNTVTILKASTRTSQALCFLATGTIGYCSDAVSGTGTCTCNSL